MNGARALVAIVVLAGYTTQTGMLSEGRRDRNIQVRVLRLTSMEEHMAANAIEVTDANFDEVVINSDIPVVVDFWAPWCGPCVTAAPAVDEIAAEFKGKVQVCKMNVDVSRNTPVKYNVRSIPNFIIFKGGVLQEQFAGFSSKDQLKKIVEKYV